MPTLATFRLLAKHLIGALAGIYIAGAIARMIGWLWPSARLTAFVIASLFFIVGELSATVRELRKGPFSTGLIIFDCMPFLLLGAGVSLFFGRLASQWFGSDWGGLVVFIGVYFCILIVIAAVKQMVQDRNLQEDLEHPHADTAEDRDKARKYMHPYI